MKTVKIFFLWLLGLFLVMFFSYIAVAFVNIQFNPFLWIDDARIFLAVMWFFYLCLTCPIIEDIKKFLNKNDNEVRENNK